MDLVDIFDLVKGKLLAVRFSDQYCDEFTYAFKKWEDTEYLFNYFNEHEQQICNGFYQEESIEVAAFKTIDEAEIFRQKILKCAKKGNFDDNNSLQDVIFKPLSKNTHRALEKSKSYGTNDNSWLRVYAIRIEADCYVVTGSGIKLTATMQEDPLLVIELKKLELAQKYLKELGIEVPEDFGTIDIKKT